jgi:ABC-type dipeptide/oligopeptide/nickel transport system permease component
MTGYIVGRLMATIPILLGVSLAVFSMLHFLPGDPVLLMMSETGSGAKMADVSNETYNRVRHELGLDQPLHVQFGRFVWKAIQGDLGRSFRSNQQVTSMIGDAFPYTVRLTLAGLGLAIPIGVLLGAVAAVRHNSILDNLSMLAALFAVSMPSFWFGIMLLLVFALHLSVLPATGYGSPQAIILPAVALGLSSAAIIARLVRSSLLEILRMDYITTARAKGLAERMVVLKHALKNAMIPVVTVVGLQFGALLGGAVVIEAVFARPGLGLLLVNGINGKDFPVVQGGILMAASAYVFANLLVDVSYAWLDPRIKYGGKPGSA